jgi:hypothetical protein
MRVTLAAFVAALFAVSVVMATRYRARILAANQRLVEAVRRGDDRMIAASLVVGADPNIRDLNGTAVQSGTVHVGASSSWLRALERVWHNDDRKPRVVGGKLVNVEDESVPIICEVDADSVELLLHYGADPDAQDGCTGITAAMVAAMYGRDSSFDALVAGGASCSMVDWYGRNVSFWACGGDCPRPTPSKHIQSIVSMRSKMGL